MFSFLKPKLVFYIINLSLSLSLSLIQFGSIHKIVYYRSLYRLSAIWAKVRSLSCLLATHAIWTLFQQPPMPQRSCTLFIIQQLEGGYWARASARDRGKGNGRGVSNRVWAWTTSSGCSTFSLFSHIRWKIIYTSLFYFSLFFCFA